MDSFNVIMAPRAWNQLNEFVDYIQFTLLNEQAAKSVYNDALETIEKLRIAADSLQYCRNPRLRKRGYRAINFRRHQYLMLYLVSGRNVYVEAVYHQQQDYENTFAETLN
ncbi:MAG: type II toxin-antitoxin system RelE/ParE family toxin [Lachnospiraceae bacterium]|nr:type II toxin-antitoxin system RelE/ParE family toxin [Lachnospiraceae bacterium]